MSKWQVVENNRTGKEGQELLHVCSYAIAITLYRDCLQESPLPPVISPMEKGIWLLGLVAGGPCAFQDGESKRMDLTFIYGKD